MMRVPLGMRAASSSDHEPDVMPKIAGMASAVSETRVAHVRKSGSPPSTLNPPTGQAKARFFLRDGCFSGGGHGAVL